MFYVIDKYLHKNNDKSTFMLHLSEHFKRYMYIPTVVYFTYL